MRHIGSHHNLLLSYQIQHLRQDKILQLGAEEKIAALDVIHNRQPLEGLGLGQKLRKFFPLVLVAVIEPIDHVGDPHGAGFQENHFEIGKTVENAAADQRGKRHENGEMKCNYAGGIDMRIKIVDRWTGPTDVNG